MLLGVWQEVHYQGSECPITKGLECGFELEPVVANSYSQVQQQKRIHPWLASIGIGKAGPEGQRVRGSECRQDHCYRNIIICVCVCIASPA